MYRPLRSGSLLQMTKPNFPYFPRRRCAFGIFMVMLNEKDRIASVDAWPKSNSQVLLNVWTRLILGKQMCE